MATQQEHVAKADNNAAFAKALDLKSQAGIDWALTALFYSGVHYVDAYLEKIGAQPHTHDTHGKREQHVVMDGKLKRVRNEYFDLKNFGRTARYACAVTKANKVTDEAIPALEKIKNHIKGAL
jgi:hypothetical protein